MGSTSEPPPDEDGIIAILDDSCNLYITTRNMSETVQVTSGQYHDWNPDWGARGIVFASNRDGFQDLMTVDPDGSNLQHLTALDGAGDLHPRWSPDGNFVIFSRAGAASVEGISNIWESDLSGAAMQITVIDSFGEDADGDGVLNASDQCENTSLNATVKPEEGCSIEQLCPCEGPRDSAESWRNHGGYVSCAAKASEDFVELALITEEEKDVIVSIAAQSSCGEN